MCAPCFKFVLCIEWYVGLASTSRMHTAVSPGQWQPLDSCFALIGAHQHGIAVGSMNRENPRVSKTLARPWVGVCVPLALSLSHYSGTPLYNHPVYKTTSLLRPYSFKPNVTTIQSFYYFEDPVNATTSLLRPGFYGSTVVTLTGFHCICMHCNTCSFIISFIHFLFVNPNWQFYFLTVHKWQRLVYCSTIHANSPGYDNNLPVSHTGHQISGIKSSYEPFCALIWNLSHFLPKFKFSLIHSLVSVAFSPVFHHWEILFHHYTHKLIGQAVPHVRLHIIS